ncbi:helix-turn-helix transcriptional regulator [Actinorhabdospora filicis]|uniref:Helix-turn-helix transcriptional regulator n=1 Tax=Actinorhabdospora filicis TaxID=1785913 RepID=A0A9W6SQV9_9ACTN|nr:helix-turn-helix transcriptional regulator [Actinorhabdospora filicis]GLZ80611.1 helix-turn-helix transcriptional regulator [Actinorhabdospora filicis]
MAALPHIHREGLLAALREAAASPPWTVFLAGEAGTGKTALLADWLGDVPRVACAAGVPTTLPLHDPLVVEDAQWLDARAAARLRAIIAARRVGVVVTYRPEELPVAGLPLRRPVAWGAAHVTVGPVEPPGAHAKTVADCGGVAGVLAEVLATGASPTLDALVAGRMAALKGHALALARAAAVLREPAAPAVLAAVAGPVDLARAAERASALLTAHGTALGHRFPLAAEAAYRLVPVPVRDAMHRRALAVLTDPAALARHARAIGDPAWAGHAETAAARAFADGRTPEAIALLHDALTEPLPEEVRERMVTLLGDNAGASLHSDTTLALLREALAHATRPEARAVLHIDLGAALFNHLGRIEEARAHVRAAVAEHDGPTSTASRALSLLGFAYFPGTSLDDDRKHLARGLARAKASGDPIAWAAAMSNHATMLMATGAPGAPEALASIPTGSARERRLIARGHCNLADGAVWLGRYADAAGHLAEGARLAASTGAPFDANSAEGTSLRLDWALGRWDGLTARATAFAHAAAGMRPVAGEAHLVLGLLALARGDFDASAARLKDAALGWADDAAVPVAAATAGAGLRLLAARGEDPSRLAKEAVDRLRAKGNWVWGAELLPFSPVDATGAFAAGIAHADAPLAHAALAWCRGELDEARRRYLDLPRPYEAALVAEAAGDHATAEAEFTALGAVWDAARCRKTLRAAGHVPRGGRPGYGDRLSPREREVAELAAAGRTNREIAAALYLSPRTVEQHVASAVRKLRTTRAALTATGFPRTPTDGPPD